MKPIVRMLLAFVMLSCQLAFADSLPRAEVKLVAFKVVTTSVAGVVRESLVPLEQLRPGDTVEYEATYINRTASTARGVQLTVPIPAGGLEYVAVQKAPLADAASVDGKSFGPLPLTRIEIGANGKATVKQIPLDEYRELRWSLGDLPAGASRSVRARMHMPAVSASPASVASAHTPAPLSTDINAHRN